jgi:hypothetical protein
LEKVLREVRVVALAQLVVPIEDKQHPLLDVLPQTHLQPDDVVVV